MTGTATTIFVAALALVTYVIAGYPGILAWLSRHKQWPVAKDDVARPVSVIIAVRNGENFIADKLDSLLALDYPKELIEIIVVSDGSTDHTDEVTRKYLERGVQLWRLPRGGKATAINFGIAQARNEILVLTDVRQRLARDSVRELVRVFGDPKVGAASGKLSILNGETGGESSTGLYWKVRSRATHADERHWFDVWNKRAVLRDAAGTRGTHSGRHPAGRRLPPACGVFPGVPSGA